MAARARTDPAFDFLLMLFLAADAPLTVLPTHRVLRGLGDDGAAALVERLPELFAVTAVDRRTTSSRGSRRRASWPAARAGSGSSRARARGCWRRGEARSRRCRRPAAPRSASWTSPGSGTALERLAGIDAAAVAAGERIRYTKSASEARSLVEQGTDGADAAFLLEPTPVASILAVAAEGDVMPQKSTYFYPKALTGLVLNPHEW